MSKTDQELRYQALKATDQELARMYVKNTNKFAAYEMRQRGTL